MRIRLDRLIEDLRQHVIQMGNIVNEVIIDSTSSLFIRDKELAENVIDRDSKIDQMENILDEKALKIFALQQPLAIDLRFVTMVLKMNNDFERIGDLAVNISERVIDFIESDYYGHFSELKKFENLKLMAEKAQEMSKLATRSIVERNCDIAREVIEMDRQMDECNKHLIMKAIHSISENPEQAQFYVNIISISKNLERVGDHTTNIAQDLIFMVEGVNLKHQKNQ